MANLGLMDMLDLSPFDPKVNKPVSLPGGNIATEYSATTQLPDGSWIVYPQIWWDSKRNPRYFPGDAGLSIALKHENLGWPAFPRFKTLEDADAFASQRSHAGGGLLGTMNK